jgi:hypothetical protein
MVYALIGTEVPLAYRDPLWHTLCVTQLSPQPPRLSLLPLQKLLIPTSPRRTVKIIQPESSTTNKPACKLIHAQVLENNRNMASVPIESSLFPATNPASDNPIESSCVTFRNEWIDNSACDSSIESNWIPLTDERPASGNLIDDDWHNDCIDNRDSDNPIESSCVPFNNGWIDNTDSGNDSKLIVVTKHSVEEGEDAYRPGGFHPVFMGDVYNNRYEILRKIGYGQYSTVWLVRDLTEK